MIVLPPVNISDNILDSSNVSEPSAGETLWNPATSYSTPTRVYRAETHKIYESLSTSPTVNSTPPELSIYSSVPKWIEIQSTNKYSMFDYTNNFKTYGTGTISVTLAPISRLGSVALLGLENVANITINIIYPNLTSEEVENLDNSYIDDNGNTAYRASYINLNLPPYYNTKIQIVLSGTGTIACGICAIGIGYYIGSTQKDITLDVLNYSKTDRDIYGNVTLVKRRSIPKVRVTVFTQSNMLNRLITVRKITNAKPVIWCGLDEDVGSSYYNSLILLGFYKSFSIGISNPVGVYANIELEEL